MENEEERTMTEGGGRRALAGFIVGAAVGAALGVLFAPQEGEKTRAEVGGWIKTRRETIAAAWGRLRENLPDSRRHFVAAIKAGRHAFVEAAHRTDSKERKTAGV